MVTKAKTPGPTIRRTVTVPAYAVAVAGVTVLALLLLTLWAGIKIADQNAANLVARYQADQAATAAANRALYCGVFGRQADVFEDAESEVGRAAHEAWLELYRFAGCEPTR